MAWVYLSELTSMLARPRVNKAPEALTSSKYARCSISDRDPHGAGSTQRQTPQIRRHELEIALANPLPITRLDQVVPVQPEQHGEVPRRAPHNRDQVRREVNRAVGGLPARGGVDDAGAELVLSRQARDGREQTFADGGETLEVGEGAGVVCEGRLGRRRRRRGG